MPRKLIDKKTDSVDSVRAIVDSQKTIKKAPQKKVLVKKKSKSTPSSPIKMVTKAEKTERVKISIKSKKDTLPKKEMPVSPSSIFKSRVRIALLSPFRTPFHHTQFVSNIARYTGTSFVVIGALFTVYNINAVNSYVNEHVVTQQALVSSTSDCPGGSTDCLGQTGAGTIGSTIDTTPNADFNIESTSSNLINSVPINVTVPLATSVVVSVKNLETNQSQTLGTAFRVSDLAWRVYWQTKGFSDGRYRMKVFITNQYGTYIEENPNEYTVMNYPIEPVNTSAPTTTMMQTNDSPSTTTSTSNNSTTTQVISPVNTISPSMRIEVDATLQGSESIRTFVEGASSVKFFTRPRSGSVTTYTPLGYASFHGNNEWRYSWDTTKMPNGSYEIKSQIILITGNELLKTVLVDIQNQTLTTEITTTATATAIIKTPIENLEPIIELNIAGQSPYFGSVDLYVTVPLAQFVELYALPQNSLVPRFVGLANKKNDTTWQYRINTINIPNGMHSLFVKVRHAYGVSESKKILFSIKNQIIAEQTPEQDTYIEKLKTTSVETEIRESGELPPPPPLFKPTELVDSNQQIMIPDIESANEEVRIEIEDLLTKFGFEAQILMQAYAAAVRSGDVKQKEGILEQMNDLEKDLISKIPDSSERADIELRVAEYIKSINIEIRERVDRNESIIKERVGDAITKDTDKDGISDYDEVSIYKTDPFNADTDRDGYADGAEVLSGYNPNDSTSEVNIQFESPKEIGLVREDLLSVTTITALEESNSLEQETVQSAMISGTGLPNSFVTLYIFSTPIIVTVKTDTQGNWSYIFDKELENGEHEIYVGMTDNAGKIVAKSNPFSFVKTAEAFSPVGAEVGSNVITEASSPTLLSEQMMLVIGSIAIVAIGLVLILLGLHARPREEIPQVA